VVLVYSTRKKFVSGLRKESNDTDSRLIKRFCGGDASAFRTLVEKYKDVSLSLACSILKNEVEAQDVLQDAFLKVHKNINKFRFDSSFATWLYRIVVNTCLNAKEKDKGRFYVEIEKGEEEPSQQKAFDSLLESERNKYIVQALSLMKEDEALLLRLFYLCEQSVTEIREVTGYGESNIKVILHRGRKSMHEILQKLTGDELTNLL
jgi:RNA polymerase sigma factor (sigma-70 family)